MKNEKNENKKNNIYIVVEEILSLPFNYKRNCCNQEINLVEKRDKGREDNNLLLSDEPSHIHLCCSLS